MSEPFRGSPHFEARREFILRRLLAERPEDAEVHAYRGLYLWLRKQCKEALAAADRAIQLDPACAMGHYVRSLALGMFRISEAIAEAEEAVRLDPTCVPAYCQLAALYLRHPLSFPPLTCRRYGLAALDAAERGLAIDEKSGPCHRLRALALCRLARSAEAQGDIETALALDPESAALHACLGNLRFLQGDLYGARDAFREAARFSPGLDHRRRMQLGTILALVWIHANLTGLLLKLGFLRVPPRGASSPALRTSWIRGMALALLVLGCMRILLDIMGDRSPESFTIPCSLGAMVCGRLYEAARPRWKFVAGCATGFLGLLWLQLSALMFVSPKFISKATKAAWSHLEVGPDFVAVRASGIIFVVLMALFLAGVLFVRERPRRPG